MVGRSLTTEPSCFIPNLLQFPKRLQPIQPHIFTEAEIICLLNAIPQDSSNIKSLMLQENLRLGLILLYTTGLRHGELIRLTIGDYNPTERTLLIRETKYHKSRLIPLSCDGWTALESLLKKRHKLKLPISKESPLLWSGCKKGFYSKTNFWKIFRHLFCITKIRTANGKLPRIHDFRHSFGVHALLRWYREDINVQARLPLLSTYMGHVSIESTQYYLKYFDSIVGSANKKFEKNYSTLITKFNKKGVL